MSAIGDHTRTLTDLALRRLSAIPGLTIYGPRDARQRSPAGGLQRGGLGSAGRWRPRWTRPAWSPGRAATAPPSRIGGLGLDPLASCRLSFYLYNTADDVELATDAVRRIVQNRRPTTVFRAIVEKPARSYSLPAPVGESASTARSANG